MTKEKAVEKKIGLKSKLKKFPNEIIDKANNDLSDYQSGEL